MSILNKIHFNDSKLINSLIESNADIEETYIWDHTALTLASKHGYYDTVKLLIEKKANLESRTFWNWTPLLLSTYYGHIEVSKLLIESRSDINAFDDYHINSFNMSSCGKKLELWYHNYIKKQKRCFFIKLINLYLIDDVIGIVCEYLENDDQLLNLIFNKKS